MGLFYRLLFPRLLGVDCRVLSLLRRFVPFPRGGSGYRPDHVGFVLEKIVVRQVLGIAEAILDVAIHLRVYIVSRHSSREYRALTKFRRLARLLASTLTSFHVLPWCLISSKIVLRHVVRGLPRDLVP